MTRLSPTDGAQRFRRGTDALYHFGASMPTITASDVRRFKALLRPEGPNGAWTFMTIPFDVEQAFGTRARLPVKGTLNGFPFRTSIFPDGKGTHNMMVNKSMQKGAGASPGDTVDVVLSPDTAPRTVKVPADLAKAIAADKASKAAFDAFSPSHRKEYVEWIESAKRPETRASRIAKAVGMIRDCKRL